MTYNVFGGTLSLTQSINLNARVKTSKSRLCRRRLRESKI